MQLPNVLSAALSALAAQPGSAALLTLLVLAAISDASTFRIPNALTVSGMMLGLAVTTLMAPAASTGFLRSACGLAAAFACLVPLHALRVIGGGDVKLMAMVGAFLGLPDILPALLFVFAAGGVAALAAAASRRRMRRLLGNVGAIVRSAAIGAVTGAPAAPAGLVSAGRLPFAIPIAAGTAAFLLYRQALDA
jgi:prepilin peptidase CpaA